MAIAVLKLVNTTTCRVRSSYHGLRRLSGVLQALPSQEFTGFSVSYKSVHSVATMARRPPPEKLKLAPNGGKFKMALCQLSVTDDKGANIARAKDAIEKAAGAGAKLVVLPEMWNCPYSNDSFPPYAEEFDGGPAATPSTSMMAQAAKETGVTLIGGSIPERRDGKLYNTCCVFGPDGKLLGKFAKMHLFDVDLPGKVSFKESLTLTAGDRPLVVDTGCHMICYPGAFNTTTGPLHWELLQKARAVDNQIFVAACSPARVRSASYQAWGHSTVVGPFGEILATMGYEEGTIFADIDFTEINTRRMHMPLATQRRGDVYEVVDWSRE